MFLIHIFSQRWINIKISTQTRGTCCRELPEHEAGVKKKLHFSRPREGEINGSQKCRELGQRNTVASKVLMKRDLRSEMKI